MTIGVLFVCTANICRSPMAEGVFRTLARRAGLEAAFTIASAGTTGIHAGEAPTPAAVEAAARRGYDIAGQRSRPVTKEDIAAADYVLAMDRSHMADLRWLAPRDKAECLQMFTKFGPMPGILDVQDPVWRHAAGLRARARPDRGRLQGPAGSADTGGEGGNRQLIVVA